MEDFFFGDEIELIFEFDPLTGEKIREIDRIKIFANSHYVTPKPTLRNAIKEIKKDLKIRLNEFYSNNKILEAQRLEQRTNFDLEMMEATGSCTGIENYSDIFLHEIQANLHQHYLNIYLKILY